MVCLIAGMNAVNVFTKDGIATEEIDLDVHGGTMTELPASPHEPSSDERLRKIEQLRQEGLISKTKYATKRREVTSNRCVNKI